MSVPDIRQDRRSQKGREINTGSGSISERANVSMGNGFKTKIPSLTVHRNALHPINSNTPQYQYSRCKPSSGIKQPGVRFSTNMNHTSPSCSKPTLSSGIPVANRRRTAITPRNMLTRDTDSKLGQSNHNDSKENGSLKAVSALKLKVERRDARIKALTRETEDLRAQNNVTLYEAQACGVEIDVLKEELAESRHEISSLSEGKGYRLSDVYERDREIRSLRSQITACIDRQEKEKVQLINKISARLDDTDSLIEEKDRLIEILYKRIEGGSLQSPSEELSTCSPHAVNDKDNYLNSTKSGTNKGDCSFMSPSAENMGSVCIRNNVLQDSVNCLEKDLRAAVKARDEIQEEVSHLKAELKWKTEQVIDLKKEVISTVEDSESVAYDREIRDDEQAAHVEQMENRIREQGNYIKKTKMEHRRLIEELNARRSETAILKVKMKNSQAFIQQLQDTLKLEYNQHKREVTQLDASYRSDPYKERYNDTVHLVEKQRERLDKYQQLIMGCEDKLHTLQYTLHKNEDRERCLAVEKLLDNAYADVRVARLIERVRVLVKEKDNNAVRMAELEGEIEGYRSQVSRFEWDLRHMKESGKKTSMDNSQLRHEVNNLTIQLKQLSECKKREQNLESKVAGLHNALQDSEASLSRHRRRAVGMSAELVAHADHAQFLTRGMSILADSVYRLSCGAVGNGDVTSVEDERIQSMQIFAQLDHPTNLGDFPDILTSLNNSVGRITTTLNVVCDVAENKTALLDQVEALKFELTSTRYELGDVGLTLEKMGGVQKELDQKKGIVDDLQVKLVATERALTNALSSLDMNQQLHASKIAALDEELYNQKRTLKKIYKEKEKLAAQINEPNSEACSTTSFDKQIGILNSDIDKLQNDKKKAERDVEVFGGLAVYARRVLAVHHPVVENIPDFQHLLRALREATDQP
eukprot:CFRG8505T1